MPTYNGGSINIHYEDQGEGKPVVLIMGLGCPSSLWFNQVTEFAQSFRVITFDNRGIGFSDKPKDPYTIEAMAQDTADLIRGLDAAPAHVVGVSMGGTIAQRLAVEHPDTVNKLVLVGTWAATRSFGRELLGLWRDIAVRGGMDLLVRLNLAQYLTPSLYDAQPQLVEKLADLFAVGSQPVECYLAQNLACERHDCLDLLTECRAATLVVVGSRDAQTPVGAAKEIAHAIPRARLSVLSGVGHGLMWQDPESFNATVLDFLNEADGPATRPAR